MTDVFEFVFPGLMLMWVCFISQGVFADILVEYQANTLSRQLAGGVSLRQFLLSKMLRCLVVCWICELLLILIAAGATFFHVNLGDHPSALVPVILSFAFFCGSLGLLFGVVLRTEQQVTGLGVLATMVLAALGGCWWPLDVVPPIFKTLALFTPSYWAIQGLHDVMSFGKSWLDVLPECGILVAFGAALSAIAIPLFHREH